jgi:hypothetical protein
MNAFHRTIGFAVLSILAAGCQGFPRSSDPPAPAAHQQEATWSFNRIAVIVDSEPKGLLGRGSGKLVEVDDMFTRALLSKGYAPADRRHLAKLLEERAVVETMGRDEAQEIGKILNVDGLLFVTVTKNTHPHRVKRPSEASSLLGGLVKINVNKGTGKARADDTIYQAEGGISGRLIAVGDAGILWSDREDGSRNGETAEEAQGVLQVLAGRLADRFPSARTDVAATR